MKLKIKVHPNSSRKKIEKTADGLEIWLKEKSKDNKANIVLIKLLKRYLNKEIMIKSGFNSRNKIVEVR